MISGFSNGDMNSNFHGNCGFNYQGFCLPVMNHCLLRFKTLAQITGYVIIAGLLLSCENKIDLVPKSDLLSLPSLTVKEFSTQLTDSGKLQLIMTSPLMEQYKRTEKPYSEFKQGIKVVFYNGEKAPTGSVTSKYAKFTQPDNLWELKDSVVVVNENGDKLETEVLNWSQDKDLIYTDRFVKITNVDQVIHGFGFESDTHLNHRKIKKVQATIYLKDEE
jgi:LPS export ABC transporter protein LptC